MLYFWMIHSLSHFWLIFCIASGAQSMPCPDLIFNVIPFHTYHIFVRFLRILDQQSLFHPCWTDLVGQIWPGWVPIDCNALKLKRNVYWIQIWFKGAFFHILCSCVCPFKSEINYNCMSFQQHQRHNFQCQYQKS